MKRQFSGQGLRRHALFWVTALVVFLILLFSFSSILLPFLVGMAIAYFLDPLADWLERQGLTRTMATLVILVAFVLIFAAVLVIFIPIILNQFNDFIQNVPHYVDQLQQMVTNSKNSLVPQWVRNQAGNIQDNFSNIMSEAISFIGGLFARIWSSGKALINIMSLMVVTPVVAFYMLLDWDRMVNKIDSWIPRDNLQTVRQIARDIDRAVAGFIRGQVSLCVILGSYYAIGLSLAGLNFGLLIGLFAGLISFIPYVGSLTGLILAISVGLVQFWPDWPWVCLIFGIIVFGQFMEGNILQPKLVGSSVGLHPVWLMFALFAFGAIFGFIGLLVAVPAAAACGVLARFVLARYLESELYYGRSGQIILPETGRPPNLEAAVSASRQRDVKPKEV